MQNAENKLSDILLVYVINTRLPPRRNEVVVYSVRNDSSNWSPGAKQPYMGFLILNENPHGLVQN